jgi:hypothetical protein
MIKTNLDLFISNKGIYKDFIVEISKKNTTEEIWTFYIQNYSEINDNTSFIYTIKGVFRHGIINFEF